MQILGYLLLDFYYNCHKNDFRLTTDSPLSLSGVPSTINSANYVMFICLERVLDLGHPDAVKVFCEQMLELHRGQAQ